jgi:HEAT repeat protein
VKTIVETALVILSLTVGVVPARADSTSDVAKLTKKLTTSKKVEERKEAAEALGRTKSKDVVPTLAAALKDPAPQVRQAVAYALVEFQENAQEAVPALREALADTDRNVRYNAVVALHNLKAATGAELAPAIQSLLQGADKDDRENLVDMLMDLGVSDDAARKAILDGLTHGTPGVRKQITGQMYDRGILKQGAPWNAEVIACISQLASGDPDLDVRRRALNVLSEGYNRHPEVADVILKTAVEDPENEVADAAVGIIASISDRFSIGGHGQMKLSSGALAYLAQKLKSSEPKQRIRAAHTMGEIRGWRDQLSPQIVAAFLVEKDPAVRLAIVEALDYADDTATNTALLKSLKGEPDAKVRVAICKWAKKRAFGYTHTMPLALATLEAARSDADPAVKAAAEDALAEVKR